MLLKQTELAAIKEGRVSLVFRRWQRPTVRSGGTLKTAAGVLSIESVEKTSLSAITERDARKAGYGSLADLLTVLRARPGTVYRIAVRYAGADPRIRLRESDQLTPEEMETVVTRLRRLDAASRQGAWTRQVLHLIQKNPNQAAATLAERTGFEKQWLKTNIRKLKNLGLTISHHPGYELSPRGKAVLTRGKW